MGKIQGIRIENYGSLKSVELGRFFTGNKDKNEKPLPNLVTVIGPNGSGKSTLADAFGFIADCLEKGVEAACDLNNRGGFERIISQGSNNEAIKFEIYYKENANSSPITYQFGIAPDKKRRPYVLYECLRQRQFQTEGKGQPLRFLNLKEGKGYVYKGKKSGVNDDDEIVGDANEKVEVTMTDKRILGVSIYGLTLEYDRVVDFLTFLKSWYLCYFSPDAARQEQMFAPQPYLNRIGSNINNVAHFLYREDEKTFKKILNEIQKKIRGIIEIKPEIMGDKRVVLSFLEEGFKEPFYWTRMSDGTLKLFAYYLLLHEQTPRQLVFIEEPENGLYHQYLTDLAKELLKDVGTNFKKQLFITTHSPFFVNALKPEDVWVLEKGDDGFSKVKRASEYEFVKEMIAEEIPLGDLWYSRYFG
jgi:predicted ATPase